MPQGALPLVDNDKIDLSSAPWTMHEFFAGSGLVAYGLKDMFSPVWANDISRQKADVYEANFYSEHFLLDDIKNVRGADLPYAHLSWASFPCQDLSLAGSIGGIDARRSGLVWEWLRILDEMPDKPRVLLVENVSGLLSASNGNNYRKLHTALIERGYDCGAVVLNASLFLPQSRPRVFVIAVQHGRRIPEELIGSGPCWLHGKTAAELGKTLPSWIWWYAEKPPKRHTALKDIIETNAPFDKDDVIRLIPERHKAALHKHDAMYSTGYRRTRNGRQQLELRFDGVAGCLRTPEGGSSKQFLVVKKNGEVHARLLTVREAARLMGVPDTFILPGTYNDGYKAMGDAVALPVARFIGEKFLVKIAEAVYDD
jgi:DNA (cytosine-5)-methyltransferase 1